MGATICLPLRAIEDRRLHGSHIRTLAALVRLGDGQRPVGDIARVCGLDHRATQRALADLQAWGHIEVNPQSGAASAFRVVGGENDVGAAEITTGGKDDHGGNDDRHGSDSPLGSPPKDPGPQNTPPYIPPTISCSKAKTAAGFAEIWALYPRKVGKGAAEKAYPKALRFGSHDEIIAGLRRALPQFGPDPQFIPHLATWLNQRRWEDEPDAPNSQGPPSSDPERDQWALRLADFRQRNFWSSMWGPEPGKSGCRVPRDLLDEMAA